MDAWVDSNPERPLLPSLFEEQTYSDLVSILSESAQDLNDTEALDFGAQIIVERETMEGCPAYDYDYDLRRVFQNAKSIHDWILGTHAYTHSELYHQSLFFDLSILLKFWS
jgi:hypothetical protein